MRGLEYGETGARDAAADEFRGLDGGRGIVPPRNDQGRRGDRPGDLAVVHVVGAWRHAGPAVSAPVVAYDAKMLKHCGHLAIPHVQRGPERIAEHQHGLVFRALDFVMDRTAVRLHSGHRLSPDSVLYFVCG